MQEFSPKILVFACNWGGYASADLAGLGGIGYPPNVKILRVMCSARVDPIFVLEAFKNGSDGVLVVGCHPNYCHYIDGNIHAETRVKFLKTVLNHAGIDPKRLRVEWVSASEGARFAEVVNDFVASVKTLGPSPLAGEKPDVNALASLVAAEEASADFRLRALVGKERKIVEEGNVYGERKPQSEFDDVMSDAVRAESVRQRIYLLVKSQPMSVKDLAKIMGLDPEKVLRHIAVMKRKGLVTVDRVEGTSPLYVALEARP